MSARMKAALDQAVAAATVIVEGNAFSQAWDGTGKIVAVQVPIAEWERLVLAAAGGAEEDTPA